MTEQARNTASRLHLVSLLAWAVLAYALANLAHEGLGHGGACVLLGGKPVALSAVYFECGEDALSSAAQKWISAAGTLVNLVLAAGAFVALRLLPRVPTSGRYFLWLFFSVNALQGAGYWLFSGLGNVGDWARIADGSFALRGLLTTAGIAGYTVAIWLSLVELSVHIGAEGDRLERARTAMFVPYLAGGTLYVAAGLLNPVSPLLVLISAAAASFGGTAAFAWMHQLLRGPRWPVSTEAAPRLRPSPVLLISAAGVALLFVAVLGRTVSF
jgi:hypothetical protein